MAEKKSDASVSIGILGGFGCLLLGFLIEKGNPLALVGISALVIIIGGLSGAMITSFSLKEYFGMFKYFREAMKTPRTADRALFDMLMALSDKSRKEGLLSLETDIEDMDDAFLKKGIRLVVDGIDSTIITEIMEAEISVFEAQEKKKIAMFEAAGGFCPTMGIIGTCMGLVTVLSHLGGDASELGHSIAAAFLATLYGISFANLIFLPVGNHLKKNTKAEVEYREMMLVAILSIQNGDSTGRFESKVSTYIADYVASGD
jgi:chemotaxis protein MotA